MTTEEFSNGFQTLVSSYMRFRDFDDREPRDTIEFDEYEKSLFLTKAQEEIALSLYNGKNPLDESFEQTEELRRFLAPLVQEIRLEPIATANGLPLGVDSRSKFFTIPENLWFITYESAIISDGKCEGDDTLDVYPVTQDEYHRIKRNPFRGANGRRALRLDLSDNNIEIVSTFTVIGYYVRYLRKIRPIILAELLDDLTIGGEQGVRGSELHDSLHQRILEVAVRMALQSKGYTINNENK